MCLDEYYGIRNPDGSIPQVLASGRGHNLTEPEKEGKRVRFRYGTALQKFLQSVDDVGYQSRIEKNPVG